MWFNQSAARDFPIREYRGNPTFTIAPVFRFRNRNQTAALSMEENDRVRNQRFQAIIMPKTTGRYMTEACTTRLARTAEVDLVSLRT